MQEIYFSIGCCDGKIALFRTNFRMTQRAILVVGSLIWDMT